jgi:hypothetical protein
MIVLLNLSQQDIRLDHGLGECKSVGAVCLGILFVIVTSSGFLVVALVFVVCVFQLFLFLLFWFKRACRSELSQCPFAIHPHGQASHGIGCARDARMVLLGITMFAFLVQG